MGIGRIHVGVLMLGLMMPAVRSLGAGDGDVFNQHRVVLDKEGKLLPWGGPADQAYDRFLRLRWSFIRTKAPMSPGPPPRSSYPHYYFYCEYENTATGLKLVTKPMNDIGEKIPNWVESARLYYSYSGDRSVIEIVTRFADYVLEHGISAESFAWPRFPYTTTNAGDTEFRGFTNHKGFSLHEIQVDHAADMGLAFYRLHQLTGNAKYLKAAIDVADVLVRNVREGTAERSPWSYRVVMDSGKITAEYGANWIGGYQLLSSLATGGQGDPAAYRSAASQAREFLLKYPMETGYWTDGHTDNPVNSHTYKSNMSASNTALYMYDDLQFDPRWRWHLPALIQWTETHFVARTMPGEPATQWGANIVGEQDEFLPKMDYQTARYAAQCARWYAVSGDASYKEKAFRSLNWVTYCNNDDGVAFESPVSKDVHSWWSDEYGECPRMFYPAMAAIPEWAPRGQNHILYSAGVIRHVKYGAKRVEYVPADAAGVEYLKLAFAPAKVVSGGHALQKRAELDEEGYTLKSLGGGDFAVTVRHARAETVVVQ